MYPGDHQHADSQQLVSGLKELLPAEQVSFLTGSTASVPDCEDELIRLRLLRALEITQMISQAYDPKTAESWLFGDNQYLNGAPATLIREAKGPNDFSRLVQAAQAFIQPG